MTNGFHYVYNHVTGYRNLDESVATLSVAQGKKMLNGDLNALSELKERLHKLTSDKRKLLCDAGLPFDYLDPIFDCPDCQDTAMVTGAKMPLLPSGGNRTALSAVQSERSAGKRKF